MSDSTIITFYKGAGTDHRGRFLADLQELDISDLEQIHDYIQWLFPLPDASAANPFAPMLSDADVKTFRRDHELKTRLLKSFSVMLHFYGLELQGSLKSPQVSRGNAFSSRQLVWLRSSNHNFLRITRILRSLTLLGWERHAVAFFTCLENIYGEYGPIIGDETFDYWRNAVTKR